MPELQVLDPSPTVQPLPDLDSRALPPNEPAPPVEEDGTHNEHKVQGFFAKLRLRSRPAVGKALSVLIFLLSLVALWASVSSAVDSRRAYGIAEWTSEKDFFEFCEQHEWDGACESMRNVTLKAPPGFSLGSRRRWNSKPENARKQRTELNTPDSDLQFMWRLVFGSLFMGLLLSHRRVQRKFLNFVRRRSTMTRFLKVTKAVQAMLTLVRRHQEPYRGDEEQRCLADSCLVNMSSDRKHMIESQQSQLEQDSAGEKKSDDRKSGILKNPVHVPTDEDEDWPAWAAEFETPDEEPSSKLHDGLKGPSDWWEMSRKDNDLDLLEHEWAQHLQHSYQYDPYVAQKRWENFKRRRQEQHRALTSIPALSEAEGFLVDNDHADIPFDEYYYHLYEAETKIDVNFEDHEQDSKNSRKRICGKWRKSYREYEYEDEEDYEDEYEDEYENDYEADYKDEDEDRYTNKFEEYEHRFMDEYDEDVD